MSPEARPAVTPFQPGSGALPPALQAAIIESHSPILLLVGPDAGDTAARVAIGLAETLAASSSGVILADASLRHGRLQELLDVENLEGLSDVLLFGASLDRVRTRPDTRSFDFVPTGPYVPDPSAVLESPRWDGIARSLRAAGERLFVFIPADSPGIGILSRRVGQTVLIGDARSVDRAAARLDPGCKVVAVVEPVSAMAPGRLAAAAGPAADPASATIFDEPELIEPMVLRGDRKRRNGLRLLLLILLLAALAAAAWFAYREYYVPATATTSAEPAAETGVEPERGDPVETPIPVSVAVEAHQDLETGLERLEALRRAEPGIEFYLAPVAVRDVLYYRLLAGPVADREAGERLMARLVEAGYKTAEDVWAVRPTSHAFHLGEFDREEAARARVRELAEWTVEDEDEEGNLVERAVIIPAYVVPIRHDSGPRRYRVYAGAYESEAEAEVMREILTEAGLEARLVTRTGEPVDEGS